MCKPHGEMGCFQRADYTLIHRREEIREEREGRSRKVSLVWGFVIYFNQYLSLTTFRTLYRRKIVPKVPPRGKFLQTRTSGQYKE
jgi:hypothetical protein